MKPPHAVLAFALLLGCGTVDRHGAGAGSTESVRRPAEPTEAASSMSDNRSGGLKPGISAKVSPNLLALYRAYEDAHRQGAAFRPSDPLVRVVDDRVIVDAAASGDVGALRADLVGLGMRNAVAFGRVVSGELPISAIPALESLQSLQLIRPASAGLSPGRGAMPAPQ
jgi:hypothetical protein